MQKQKIAAAAAAIGLLLSLSACGKAPEETTAPSQSVQQTDAVLTNEESTDAFSNDDLPASGESSEKEPPYTLGAATTHQIYQTEDGLQLINGEAGFALVLPKEWEGNVDVSYDNTACRVQREGEIPFVIHGVKEGDEVRDGEVTLGSNNKMTYYFCVSDSLDATEKMKLLQTAKDAFFMLDLGAGQAAENADVSASVGLQAASTDGMFYVNTARGITVRLPKEIEDQFGSVRYDAGSVYFYNKPAEKVEEEGQQVYQRKYSPFYVYFITSEQAMRGVMDEIEQTAYSIEERNDVRYYVVLEEEDGQVQQQVQQVKNMISWLDAAQY